MPEQPLAMGLMPWGFLSLRNTCAGPSVLWGLEVGMGVCVYVAQFVDAISELPDAFN